MKSFIGDGFSLKHSSFSSRQRVDLNVPPMNNQVLRLFLDVVFLCFSLGSVSTLYHTTLKSVLRTELTKKSKVSAFTGG